jgi:hypothetical protein
LPWTNNSALNQDIFRQPLHNHTPCITSPWERFLLPTQPEQSRRDINIGTTIPPWVYDRFWIERYLFIGVESKLVGVLAVRRSRSIDTWVSSGQLLIGAGPGLLDLHGRFSKVAVQIRR